MPLRWAALIIQKMLSIFPRNQAKAYGKKTSIIYFIPVETNYLAMNGGLSANCPLSPGGLLTYVLWHTGGRGVSNFN